MRMGRTDLRGSRTRGVAGVLLLAGLLLSCTDRRSLVGTVVQPAAAIAAPANQRPSSTPSSAAAAATASSNSFDETLDLAGLQDRFADVTKRVSPSVVAISATEAGFDFESA